MHLMVQCNTGANFGSVATHVVHIQTLCPSTAGTVSPVMQIQTQVLIYDDLAQLA